METKYFKSDTWTEGLELLLAYVNQNVLSNNYLLIDVGFTATAKKEVLTYCLFDKTTRFISSQPRCLKVDHLFCESWDLTFS